MFVIYLTLRHNECRIDVAPICEMKTVPTAFTKSNREKFDKESLRRILGKLMEHTIIESIQYFFIIKKYGGEN